jgi:hypothetical protein
MLVFWWLLGCRVDGCDSGVYGPGATLVKKQQTDETNSLLGRFPLRVPSRLLVKSGTVSVCSEYVIW